MSIGPSLGIIGGMASVPATQRNASADGASAANSRQQGEVKNDMAAAEAAGIGKTDGDQHETNERDADGRLAYEHHAKKNPDAPDTVTDAADQVPEEPHLSKDLTGDSGGSLDLLG